VLSPAEKGRFVQIFSAACGEHTNLTLYALFRLLSVPKIIFMVRNLAASTYWTPFTNIHFFTEKG
jgi:hypothetical protein